MKHAWNQKTDPVEFEFNGFEISSATRPSINPIAYPAKKKNHFQKIEREDRGIGRKRRNIMSFWMVK